ncbi:MAG: hypothetical protein ACRDWT_09305 [Jatrophihabitantaceae bacterium]
MEVFYASDQVSRRLDIVAAIALFGFEAPAFAAGSYGGPGTPFQVSQWNYVYQGFAPTPPSSVPSSSTITGVTYSLNYSSPGAVPSGANLYICYNSLNTCYNAYRFTNSTSSFNGLPASTTSIFFAVRWYNGFSSGTISGGPISFTDSLTVSYS